MRAPKLRKFLLVVLFLLLGAALFYKFMTYDRNYNWSKEYEYEIMDAISGTKFKINEVQVIDVDGIKLPFARRLKIRI